MTDELEELLRKTLLESVKVMAERAQEGTITAADIRHIRELYKECGGELLNFQGTPTSLGDDVLASLANIDMDSIN